MRSPSPFAAARHMGGLHSGRCELEDGARGRGCPCDEALPDDVAKDLAYVQLAIPHELPQGWRLLDSVTQRAVELLLVEQAEHLASAPPKPIDQPT